MSSNRVNVYYQLLSLVQLLTLVMGSEQRQFDFDPTILVNTVRSLSYPGCKLLGTGSAESPEWILEINNRSRPNWNDSPHQLWDSDCTFKDIFGRALPWKSTSEDHHRYFDTVQLVLFHNNDITHIDNGYFCRFKNILGVFLEDNQLNDVTRIGFGQEDGTFCGDQLLMLSLSGNPLVSIPNDSFSGLQQLVELNLANCRLLSIEAGAFNQLQQLRTLHLRNNYLTYFDSVKPDIRSPQLFHRSRVHSVRQPFVSQLPRLEELDLSNNKLANASLTSFDHLKSLRYLYLNENLLESIPNVTGLANLKTLNLTRNSLRSIKSTDFAGCKSLNTLDLSFNRIRAIANGTIDGLIELEHLSLDGNDITHFNQISFPSRIISFKLEHNKLTELTFPDLPPTVESLYLANNMIEHVQLVIDVNGSDYNSVAKPHLMDLRFNRLTSVDSLNSLTLLRYLFLSNNVLVNMSFNSFNNHKMLYELLLDGNELSFFPNISGLVDLFRFSMANNSLTSLKRSDFIDHNNIFEFNLSSNQINDIEDGTFDGFKGLRYLDLSNNRITSLGRTFVDIQLSGLNLAHNRLTEISFSQIPSRIRNLYLSHNMIGHIEMYDVNKTHDYLSRVDLSFNRLVAMDGLYLPTSIIVFDITNNPIRSFSFDPTYNRTATLSQATFNYYWWSSRSFKSEFFPCLLGPKQCRCSAVRVPSSLQTFYSTKCSMSNITRVPEEFHHENLTFIDASAIWLDGNNLTTIKSNDFNATFNLEKLYLNDSNVQIIEDDAFRNLNSLRILHLEHNRIRVITSYMVKGLRGLREIYLNHNEISHIDEGTFSTLQSLETLHLHNNRLVHFNIVAFYKSRSVKSLSIHHNPWKCDYNFIRMIRNVLKYFHFYSI